jgi:hypothetical protein
MSTWQDRRERATLIRALSVMLAICPDCATVSFKTTWDGPAARWRVVVYHLPTCVCLRHAPSRRACDRWLVDQLTAAGVYVADYCDIVAGLHR